MVPLFLTLTPAAMNLPGKYRELSRFSEYQDSGVLSKAMYRITFESFMNYCVNFCLKFIQEAFGSMKIVL